ncbi:MAG: NADH:flavin oxidoreductase [Clostridiales bacterium]|jgi:2,4-dienoyl-CoA reductase-like NADH-dependent reductase (Old Yellow Enzyme family)|nr:NADH:flavin oxidoreductase [Clostridiales bacterium]
MNRSNTPIVIGSKTVKNRVTFAPAVRYDWSDGSGHANERFARHYEARAAGGAGLIVVEATCVRPDGKLAPSQLGLWEDSQIQGHAAIAEACRRHGAVVLVQIHHAGYNTHPECAVPKGPSAMEWRTFRGTVTTQALTIAEIGELRDRFVDAAIRAQKAGYDGIQLHGCHGYLVNDFVSPAANLRTDAYGGCTENRARFGCEIIRGIRGACGSDFIISVRTPVAEPTIEEACAVADAYAAAGADYIQTSLGIASTRPEDIGYPGNLPYNSIVWAGTMIHRHMSGAVPVSVVNGINTPELANYILDNDLADTVDSARALLADPNWARAVTQGTGYVPCRGCGNCLWSPLQKHNCPAVAERRRTDPDCIE